MPNSNIRKKTSISFLFQLTGICSIIFFLGGCSFTNKGKNIKITDSKAVNLDKNDYFDENINELSVCMLSPGDEIKISIFQHDELERRVVIPSDGKFYYPIVGEVDVEGKGLRELRETIVRGLSKKTKQLLFPGDEIDVTVFNNSTLNSKIIIPPDGYIFYPLVGEINTNKKTLREIRTIITKGLSKYRNYYLMPGDEISITVFDHDEFNRKIVIPPDGYIFYPFMEYEKSSAREF